MKTFAYLALIGTALAIRLTEGGADTAAADAQLAGAGSLADAADLTVADLGEKAAKCLLKKTKKVLAERGLPESDVEAVGGALEQGGEEGRPLGEAVEFLRDVGADAGASDGEVERALKEIAGRAKRCAKGDDSSEELELAQEGAEATAEELLEAVGDLASELDLDAADLEGLKQEARDAAEGAGLDLDKAGEALDRAAEGDLEKVKEALGQLTDEQKEALLEGAKKLVKRAKKAKKARKEDGAGQDGEE